MFSKIQIRTPKFNKFDLSHERKMSLQMGNLVPLLVQEVLPGDRFRVSSEVLLRMAPMLAPVMHRVNVFTHYFFVPNRLVWDEWEDFITGGRLGTTAPVAPYFQIAEATRPSFTSEGSLPDYMGLPTLSEDVITNPINISALPFRAYQLIYDEYYRDQNLSASIAISKASGNVGTTTEFLKLMTLRKRAWEKDYFTSALPFAQRGAEVSIPVESEVTYLSQSLIKRSDGSNPGSASLVGVDGIATNAMSVNKASAAGAGVAGRIENIDEISSVSVTINEWRLANALQKVLEKAARVGSRYTEYLKGFFGAISPDARLQRPEYLGGGMTPVSISEVLSTFQAETGNPQANMAGHGVSFGNQNGFMNRFTEHGFVIGIMSVIPKTAYQQGIPRFYRRDDRFDYYVPEFAHLGEQEVKQSEIYYDPQGAASQKDITFGYQSRWSDMKYTPSSVHGTFRTNMAFWHMGRIFDSDPALNAAFVESDPTTRIFAVGGDDPDVEQLYAYIYNNVSAIRAMPYFSTPSL